MDARADQAGQTSAPSHGIAFRDAVRVWARIAALSFGGPAGQIAVMHRILVDEKRWIGEERFLHAPFPAIVLTAGLIGFFAGRAGAAAFRGGRAHGSSSVSVVHDRDTALGEELPEHAKPNARWSFQISATFLLLWLGPLAALLA